MTDTELPLRPMRVVMTTLLVALLPTFLVGALAGPITRDLGVGTTAIGAAVSAFFLAAASMTPVSGRTVDRIGARAGYRFGMTGVGLASALIGGVAEQGWHLAAAMALGGASLAFVDPSIGRTIAGAVGWRRHGTAFGLKEASVPLSSMVAGVTLPLLGATVGWQVPFLVVAGLAWAIAAFVPASVNGPILAPSADTTAVGRADVAAAGTEVAATGGSTRELALLAGAAGIAGGLGAAVATFLVATSIVIGLGATAAGLVLSVGSIVSVFVRLGAGWFADRRPAATLDLLVGLLVAGGLGLVLLAVAAAGAGDAASVDALSGDVAIDGPVGSVALWRIVVLVLGAVLMLGPGWGWSGLVFLTATRLVPGRPGQASSAMLAGLGGGGAVVPIAAGRALEVVGFGWTWTAAAIGMVGAVALMMAVRRRAHAVAAPAQA